MSVTLGIDIGTSGTKTLAIDDRGAILASAVAEYPCSHPNPGWSEQDPELWWNATVQTLRSVLAAGTFAPADVQQWQMTGARVFHPAIVPCAANHQGRILPGGSAFAEQAVRLAYELPER